MKTILKTAAIAVAAVAVAYRVDPVRKLMTNSQV
jgi:hypothetical protein